MLATLSNSYMIATRMDGFTAPRLRQPTTRPKPMQNPSLIARLWALYRTALNTREDLGKLNAHMF